MGVQVIALTNKGSRHLSRAATAAALPSHIVQVIALTNKGSRPQGLAEFSVIRPDVQVIALTNKGSRQDYNLLRQGTKLVVQVIALTNKGSRRLTSLSAPMQRRSPTSKSLP